MLWMKYSARRVCQPGSHGRGLCSARGVSTSPNDFDPPIWLFFSLLRHTPPVGMTHPPYRCCSDGREGHVDLADDASASSVRHDIGEAYARKDQYTCESRRDGIHNHAMPNNHHRFPGIHILRGPGRVSILAQHYRWGRSRSDFRATCQSAAGIV